MDLNLQLPSPRSGAAVIVKAHKSLSLQDRDYLHARRDVTG